MKHDLFHLNVFHQPSYNLRMYEGYILTTSRFPLVYVNNTFCNYLIEHTPGKQVRITINILFQLNYLNLICTEEIDLLEFKENNNLPPWYPIFRMQYTIEIEVSYTEFHTFVQLLYIDMSTDSGNYPPGEWSHFHTNNVLQHTERLQR